MIVEFYRLEELDDRVFWEFDNWDMRDKVETAHLRSLPGSSNRLRLFQINLLDPDSILAAIHDVSGVFHLASPFIITRVQDPQRELLDPAVIETLNVLHAAKESGVRRVVITLSISAIVPSPGWPANRVKDKSCWTDLDYCRQKELWYPASKTMDEKAAWEFANENRLDVVVVNPGTVLGPIIPLTINSSMTVLVQLLKGHELSFTITVTYPNTVLATLPLGNFYRSPNMGESIDFCIHVATPVEKIAIMRERILGYLENKKEHWYPGPLVVLRDVDDMNKLKISIWMRHRINFQDMGERFVRRELVVQEMIKVLRELDIEYRMATLDVNIYQIAINISMSFPSGKVKVEASRTNECPQFNNYDPNPLLHACGISIVTAFTQVGGIVLQPPQCPSRDTELATRSAFSDCRGLSSSHRLEAITRFPSSPDSPRIAGTDLVPSPLSCVHDHSRLSYLLLLQSPSYVKVLPLGLANSEEGIDEKGAVATTPFAEFRPPFLSQRFPVALRAAGQIEA
ncbi:hypothetical protein ZIOFF_051410 [Zingiber officinale]|uniref:NAD-dependent epimerase/dehydratase domain-containing protein n=1 Tax=Zingiber officinale TaxID=94328 RepID=A0A8J5KRW3_ZINOF|nr:hypothetical protein ZIOFF_051410 [Zingiber officinale]